MITLICSDDREDNIDHIYSLVSAGAAAGRRQLVIVPETHSHYAEKRLLAQCGCPAGEYAQVRTFSRVSGRILEENRVEMTPVDAGGRMLIMYKAVRMAGTSLEYYTDSALRPETLSALASVVSELRSCLVAPETIAAAYDQLSPKLRDIGRIYSAYCAVCGEKASFGADVIEAALPYAGRSAMIQGADVYVYGFEGFTAAEYRMLGAMLRGASSVTIALTVGDDTQLFAEQIKTKGRLERLASSAGMDWIISPPSKRRSRDGMPCRAAKAMFDFSYPPQEGADGLRIYRCGDVYEECEFVAGQCRRLVLEEGARLKSIGIVTSQPDKYEKYLIQSFNRFGLPLYMDRKDDLLDKPAAMAALGALRAIEDDLSFASMLKYLKSGLIGFTRDEQEKLENYAYTWQIRGSRWMSDWDMSVDGYDGRDSSAELEELNGLRRRLVTPLKALRDALPSGAEGRVYTAAVREHMAAIGLENAIEERADLLGSVGRRQEAAEYLQIFDIIKKGLDEFEEVMGGDELSRSDFLSLFELMLGQYKIGTIPVSLDSVEFSDFAHASFESIEHLFVMGSTEGQLPPSEVGGSLLKERDRIMLETCGIELTQSDEERIFEGMSSIYQVINNAVKSVCFTYPARTFGGADATKSYLLGHLEQVFPGSAERDCAEELRRASLMAGIPSFELMCRGSASPEKEAALSYYADLPEGKRLRRLAEYSSAGRGPVASLENIRQLYGRSVYMSATRAEKISSCRFAFFMEYGLKAKERRMAEFRATNVGTLVHYVVENAVKVLCGGREEDPEAVVQRYVERFLKERLGGSEGKTARFMANYHLLEENILDIVRDIMEEIDSSDFKPIAFEMGFGRDGDFPAYKIKPSGPSGCGIDLHGQIDRVDGYVSGDDLYIRVSDYKTGSKEFSLSDILDGINMQMFIYLMMINGAPGSEITELARRVLGKKASKVTPCAALYIPVKSTYVSALPSDSGDKIKKELRKTVERKGVLTDDRQLIDALEHPADGEYRFLPVSYTKKGTFTASSKVVSQPDIDRLIHRTEENLRRIAEIISKGEIEADPYAGGGGRTYCDWCPYRQACQFDVDTKKDKYRYLKKLRRSEVLELLAKEEGEKNGR